MEDATTTKRCGGCHAEKPTGEFYRRSRSKDGLQLRCKNCQGAELRERLAAPLGGRAKVNRTQARADLERSGIKVCRKCGIAKTPSDFYKREQALDGLYPDCKDCRSVEKALENVRHRDANRERSRLAYEAARELRLEAQRRWDAENRDKRADARGRRRARLRETATGPIDLEALWTGECPLCNEGLSLEPVCPDPMSRSLDHIIPLARGGTHEQSNLQWTHLRCNIRKGARPTD